MKKEWVEFLRKAKLNGYASESSVWENTSDGGKTTKFKEGNLVYTDTYFGSLTDCGQERLLENEKVVWTMAYRGGIFEKYKERGGEAFSFLKKCISKIPEDFPARGPKSFEEDDWRYENNWMGDIEDFVGEENIYYKDEKICFRNYLGGIVRNK